MGKGGPRDFIYVSPERMFEIERATKGSKRHTLGQLQRFAQNDGDCEVCGAKVWRYADTGLCFTCTTGESDASSDYELIAFDDNPSRARRPKR